MALTVDYSTVTPWLITIPKSDLTLITGTQYQLTVDEFWILLRDFTDNETPVARPKLYSRIPATSSTPSITTIDDDYSLEFEDGLYSVNIINGNTNIREVEVKNQVSVNTNNTTGFIDPEFLQSSTFIGKEGLGISIAATSGTDSSTYPIGIEESPCKTEANIEAIHDVRGYRKVFVQETMTLIGNHSLEKHIWFGANPQDVTLTLDNACNVANNKFLDLNVVGKLDSGNELRECIVGSITNANGFIYKSTITGPIVVSGTLSMEECWTATPGTDNIIDFNSTANIVGITDWSGGTILVKNMVAGCTLGMGGTAGSLSLDSSCTGGLVNHGGAIRIKSDLSTGTTINDASTATQVWESEIEGTYTAEQVLRIMSAALAGKASGLDTLNPVFRDLSDTKNRITATTDASGNRSAVTVDGA